MKIILHGGRFDGETMDPPDGIEMLETITRLDLPYNPGSNEVPPFLEHVPEVTYRRSNRILAGHHVFVLDGSKL